MVQSPGSYNHDFNTPSSMAKFNSNLANACADLHRNMINEGFIPGPRHSQVGTYIYHADIRFDRSFLISDAFTSQVKVFQFSSAEQAFGSRSAS